MADQLATQVQQNDEDMAALARELAKKPREQQQEQHQQLAPAHSDAPTPVAHETKQKRGFWASLCCCCCPSSPPASSPPQSTVTPSQSDSTPPPQTSSTSTPTTIAANTQKFLLPPLPPEDVNKKTLVLDLDETLVHSSFKPIPDPDFVMSIELENVIHKVYVRKRPGVDNFLRVVGEKFEVVVFTASLAKYADPLLDILDRGRLVKKRLFREACVQHYGNYVKDLSHLGRPLTNVIIIDNSPFSYMFQPDNAIPITSWFNDKADRQLYDLLPFLEQLMYVDDVCTLLQRKRMNFQTDPEQ
jgi:RNA polymerase II subunit A small phosphatase-like protein